MGRESRMWVGLTHTFLFFPYIPRSISVIACKRSIAFVRFQVRIAQ